MKDTTTTTAAPDAESLGYYVPEALAAFNLDAIENESDRERLAAIVPNPALVNVYVNREVDGVNDLSLFGVAMDEQKNVLLTGPTGSAKTTAARTFAALHGLPFVALPINGAIDPGVVWGRYVLTADKSLEWIDSPAALVLKYGGVIVWDELNMASESVTAAFHSVLDDLRAVTVLEHAGETIRAHRATMFFATMNPGYRGTRELNEALARRFRWQIDWQYDAAVESHLIASPSLVAFANDVRALPDVRSDLSTDALVSFVQTARRLGVRFAASRLLQPFRDSERGGVRRALELHLPAIASDLGLEAPKTSDQN